MDRKALLNAFLPATEVNDPTRFAGRREEVATLLDALRVEGSVPLIYGHRGLGKSSLAIQMARIAQGDVELLHHLGLGDLAFDERSRFVVFRVTCTHTTANLDSLLQLMINEIEGETATAEATRETVRAPGATTATFRASIKMLEYERTQTLENRLARESYESLGVDEKFRRLVSLIAEVYGLPVLFVIDEVDRLTDSCGLAGFLKVNSSESLKFVLVGIAGSHAELLADHLSVDRQLVPVSVGQMSPDDLAAIVDGAVTYLRSSGVEVRFTPRARDRLARLASGFPWFVHVLGQTALVSTVDDGRDEVLSADVSAAVDSLISSRFAQKYADQYQGAVRDSRHREIVLRLCAIWDAIDIPTAVIYPMARNLGVSNPSLYKGHLMQQIYGAILYSPAFQDRGVVRFRDEMFKVYVRLRPSIYPNVDLRVQEQYDDLLSAT